MQPLAGLTTRLRLRKMPLASEGGHVGFIMFDGLESSDISDDPT
jgi:hypothetical protein